MNKLFLSLLMVVALTPVSFGAIASVTETSADTNNLVNTGIVIYDITIANSAASATTVRFYDAPSTALTYEQAEYTNRVITVGLTTNTLVNVIGRTNVTVFPSITSTDETVAASTANYRLLTTIVVPASSTTVFQPSVPVLAIHGLTVANDTNAAVTVTYNKLSQ